MGVKSGHYLYHIQYNPVQGTGCTGINQYRTSSTDATRHYPGSPVKKTVREQYNQYSTVQAVQKPASGIVMDVLPSGG